MTFTQVTLALGNTKPPSLQAAESSLWKAIVRVASGSSASVEVTKVITDMHAMFETWEESPDFASERTWFSLPSR